MTRAQKDKMRELAETMTVENTPTSRTLVEKVKEMFS